MFVNATWTTLKFVLTDHGNFSHFRSNNIIMIALSTEIMCVSCMTVVCVARVTVFCANNCVMFERFVSLAWSCHTHKPRFDYKAKWCTLQIYSGVESGTGWSACSSILFSDFGTNTQEPGHGTAWWIILLWLSYHCTKLLLKDIRYLAAHLA